MDESLLQDFRGARERHATEADVALLIARLLNAAVDVRAAHAALAELAGQRLPDERPWQLLRRLGFAGNAEHFDAPDNSNLGWVLAARRGIPISLGVVLISVARHMGFDAAGINFPGHFLVNVGDEMVDPFAMQPVDRQAFVERLPEHSRGLPPPQLFARAGPLDVGLRMLNNLKMIYTRRAMWDRMLDVVDAQIALAPEHPALHLERGDLWRRIGLVAPARSSYREALSLADRLPHGEGGVLAQAARSRLAELGGGDDVLH